MDETFEAACKADEIVGAVLLAADKSGKNTFHFRGLGPPPIADLST